MRRTWSAIALAMASAVIVSAQDYPRIENFWGYTYTRFNSASNVPAFSANGGSGQLGINFNKHVGFVVDIGAVHNGNISDVHLDSTFTTFLFGPRFSFSRSRVRPYFNVLFGAVHAGSSAQVTATPVATPLPTTVPGGSDVIPGQPVTLRAVAAQTSFAMTTGIGLDIKINRHVSFRLFGLDYFMTRLQNLRSAQDNNQHNLRYTTGLNFTFGGEAPTPAPPPPPPPPPPMKACWDGTRVLPDADCPKRSMDLRLTPGQVDLCPGTTLTIGAPGQIPPGATFQWTVDGQPVSKESSLEFGTTGRQPGPYKVGLTVAAADYNDASTERTLTVGSYTPPSGSLQVSPAEIWAGEKATVAANFRPGQCGGALGDPVFTASEGSVSGGQFDSAAVQFDPASGSEQRKTITVVARVSDERGSGTAQAALVVKKAAATQARRLPDIIFPAGNARVNNCGKRVLLEELKAIIDTDPNGKVVFVGHVSAKEAGRTGLDQQRALNAAAVISAGQGVCSNFAASKILVGTTGAADNGADFQSRFCGSTQEIAGSIVKEGDTDAKFRRVEVWFVPSSASLPASLKDHQEASALSVSNLGCPK